MKAVKKICLVALTIILLASQMSFSFVSAEGLVEKEGWSPYIEGDQFEDIFEIPENNRSNFIADEVTDEAPIEDIMALYSSGCDQYGYTGWQSLPAAQSYYGYGFSYFSVFPTFIYNGGRYTHYYLFSNGSRMYFGVNPKK